MEITQTQEWGALKKIALGLVACVLFAFLGYYAYSKTISAEKKKIQSHDIAYKNSLLASRPQLLQASFVKDIENGVNDMYTKSDAYFITHRYFDNGGNIYEIYDYVNSHPELAFLKEAESIYPEDFKRIQDKVMSKTYTDSSLYAYLAYVEVLNNHGYTDMAALGTAANQYAKTAYFTTTIAKEMKPEAGARRSRYAERNKAKAIVFANKTKQDVVDVLDGKITTDTVPARDILVGLNQYAAFLRYLQALGVQFDSPKSASEIFAFTMGYAPKYVPELYIFTSYLNASTLAVLDSSSEAEVKSALKGLLDFDTRARTPQGIIKRVIDSKDEVQPSDVGNSNMDIYGKRNTLRLAEKVPEFKTWLKANGWADKDFDLHSAKETVATSTKK